MKKNMVMCTPGDIREDLGYTGKNGSGDSKMMGPTGLKKSKAKKSKKKKKVDVEMAGKEAFAKKLGLKY